MQTILKKSTRLFLFTCFINSFSFAGPGDTIKVQTFTFGSAQDAWFEMPSLDVEVEKILMKYTLKCNPAQSPACGEWDYLTYTYLYQNTGNYDSTLLTHANYLENNASPDTFNYSISPTYTYTPRWEYFIVYDDTISYSETTLGNGTSEIAYPFTAANPLARTQMLWRADELIAAGLTAGNITAMQFNLSSAGSTLKNLKIKIKNTAIDSVTPGNYESAGFTTVYNQTTSFEITGWNALHFTSPFYWDGISNVLIEITFDNTAYGTISYVMGDSIDYNCVMHTNSDDKYIGFQNPYYASMMSNPLNILNDEITVSFWAYGNGEFEPQNGTTFEGVTSDNQRVINSHTPWGDENVYWDAGNDAGYNRINKVASSSDYENKWTHWAFTKNASTGEMKIYKNGVLWHSGTGKTKTITGIDKLWLGKGTWAGSESYEGKMDEFAIWNKALDATTIYNYLYKDLDAAHPNADNLLLYYHFNDATGLYQNDASASNADLALFGATTKLISAQEQFRNLQFTNIRPNVKFEQGNYISHIDSVLIIDTIQNNPITLVQFDPLNPEVGLDTSLVWPANYYTYIYDAAGNVTDSNFIAATNTIYHEEYSYYSAPFEIVNRYELARYITPYGIGLDLGDGFTWTYDVSDYRSLLKDSVHLSAGNWQELLGVQFLFIEGTPPRNPLSVTNLWSGGFAYGVTPSFDEETPPVDISIPLEAKNTRVKVRVTGHGFGGTSDCSEFCARDHYLKINGETKWTQNVWRETCDFNPVYPQGGTWVYDRANWCPGAEVQTYDVEVTPFVTPASNVQFDYNAENYTWNGAGSLPYYQTEVQLITYGEPNFNLDAAVEDIISPSNNDMWGRKNPVCNNAVIKIKNTGATVLTSLIIQYGIKDNEKSTYNWSGNLNFMESEEVTLGDFVWNIGSEFEVEISNPNGQADEYAYNNKMTSHFIMPPTYPNNLVLEFKTNSKPNENDLFVYDAAGNEILAHTSFTANTISRDTLNLPDGCYEIYLNDSGQDGISWWANADGTGYFHLKNADDGSIIKVYEPDFGGGIYEQFTVGTYTEVQPVKKDNSVEVYPNPTNGEFFISMHLPQVNDAWLSIYDFTGKLIKSENLGRIQNQILREDISAFSAGMYFIVLRSNNAIYKKSILVEK